MGTLKAMGEAEARRCFILAVLISTKFRWKINLCGRLGSRGGREAKHVCTMIIPVDARKTYRLNKLYAQRPLCSTSLHRIFINGKGNELELKTVLWIRIRKEPNLNAGFGAERTLSARS